MPSSQYDLSFIAKFVNKLSKGMGKAGRDVSKFGKDISQTGSDAKLASSSIEEMEKKSRALADATRNMRVAIGVAGVGATAWAMKGALEYDEALSGILVSIDAVGKEANTFVKRLSRDLVDLSMKWGRFTPIDLSEAFIIGRKEFGDIPDLYKRVEVAARAAMVSQETSVVPMMTLIGQLSTAFQDSSFEFFEKTARQLPRVAVTSMMHIQALTHALARAVPLGVEMGLTAEEMLSQFMALSKVAGTQASLVGFQLATLFRGLGKYDDVRKILEKVGEATKKVGSPFHGKSPLVVLLKLIKEYGKDPAKLREIFEGIGARGMVGLIQSLSQIEDLEKQINALLDSRTLIRTEEQKILLVTKDLMEPKFEFGRFKMAINALRIELGNIAKETALPWFKGATKGLDKLIDGLRYAQDIMNKTDSKEVAEREKRFMEYKPGFIGFWKDRLSLFQSDWNKVKPHISTPGAAVTFSDSVNRMRPIKDVFSSFGTMMEKLPQRWEAVNDRARNVSLPSFETTMEKLAERLEAVNNRAIEVGTPSVEITMEKLIYAIDALKEEIVHDPATFPFYISPDSSAPASEFILGGGAGY